MIHSTISGLMWTGLGLLLIVQGIADFAAGRTSEGVFTLIPGVALLVFEFYTYRRTGTVKGIL